MSLAQSRTESLAEAVVNTAIGFVVAVLSQLVVFPKVGIHIPFSLNLEISMYFTAISIARSYVIRRWFNTHTKQATAALVRLFGRQTRL